MRALGQFKRNLRAAHRAAVFHRAFGRFLRDPGQALRDGGALLGSLVYGWGNEAWSGQHEFLGACLVEAMRAQGAILECGSGLSTLLVATIATQRDLPLCSLEHQPAWRERVQRVLDRAGLRARLCDSPLERHRDFDWYRLPDDLPAFFSLVICDGPPATTRGGRYGLVPVMRDRLAPGCVLLLDDAERAEEQAIAQRWADTLACRPAIAGTEKPYLVLRLPGRRADSVDAAAHCETPAPTLP